MNVIHLIGRVGKDPEIKNLESGTKVAKFSLAVSEKFTRNGERVEETEWFNIAIFGKLAEVAEKYVNKGDKLQVSGKFRSREYEDKEGITRRAYEVNASGMEMLGGKPGEAKPEAVQDQVPTAAEPIDDLPF